MKEINLRKKLMLKTLSWIEKKADKEFQLWARLKGVNKDGLTTCISCHKTFHYTKGHGGHFIPRHHKNVRYEPNNCFFQCVRCNKFLSGNHSNYRETLMALVGEREVEKLESIKNIIDFKYREKAIETLIKYKVLNSAVLKERGF